MAEEEVTKFSPRHVLQHRAWGCRRAFRIIQNRHNGFIWPGSVCNLSLVVGGITAARFSHVPIIQPIKLKLETLEATILFVNEPLRAPLVCVISGLALFLTLTLVRRLALRGLLAYRAWMYEASTKRSVSTTLWAILVKSVRGWRPSLYSHQVVLPRLAVPPLNQTIEKLVASLEPLYTDNPDGLEELRRESREFLKTVGPKLQRALIIRSWWADNYVTDWWENYVYLMGRSPLPINSNYYIMDQSYWTPTSRQCARAAGVLYQILRIREAIVTEELEPLVIRETVPVCMEQYRRIFSTTRVPGEEIDKLVHYPASKSQHIVVNRRGLLYKLDITDYYGRLVSPCDLERQLEWIQADADTKYSEIPEAERLIPVLTSIDRTTWARTRSQYFSLGVNKESLDVVESAIMYLVLDTIQYPDLSSRAAHLLHGDVGLFWFDKSFELIAMTDGHVGLNCEHSYADAPAVGHVLEYNLTYEVLGGLYSPEGHCVDVQPVGIPTRLKSKPSLLQWEVDAKLEAVISSACVQASKNIKDLDLLICDHDRFGKGTMKKCKVSPDAFIQMALNATYRRLTGIAVLTYEAAMTRLYKNGRTETVRSLTKEANNFVVALLDSSVPKQEKRRLLVTACDKHTVMYKDAMNNKGIDRHLFALYVVSRGLGMESEFLKKVLSIPWVLSTSQQPQQQISWSPDCNDEKYSHQLCPGGGFGPVATDGYGVSYMVPGDRRIFFHVSSRRSSGKTSSAEFVEALKTTMSEMRDLFTAD
ncbi:unnamed protein product [Lymnaea stagnalis]|uniref:Choline/carnitine acyltransferase domain-containing protein n=1 Tax=Lymnaea stagnalis TaxID=6523 RepID=A0AAV2HPX8_LYMST